MDKYLTWRSNMEMCKYLSDDLKKGKYLYINKGNFYVLIIRLSLQLPVCCLFCLNALNENHYLLIR